MSPEGSLEPEYFIETVLAELMNGASANEAVRAGIGVVLVDLEHFYPGTQSTKDFAANTHAMGGRKPTTQSCGEAYAGAARSISTPTLAAGMKQDIFGHFHTIQDSYSDSHNYQLWGGHLTWRHVLGDIPLHLDAALVTARYLHDLRTDQAINPYDYLKEPTCNGAF